VIDHRRLGVDLFNEVWRLMESRAKATLAAPRIGQAGSARVSDLDDDRMLHAAHASRFHWGEAPECGPGNAEAADWKSKARAAGAEIADTKDREHFEEDFATLS